MRQWSHDELHILIDNNPSLKTKSDGVHALPQTSLDEREQGKLQMMEIYTEIVGCKQIKSVKEFVRKAFSYMKRMTTCTFDTLREECVSNKSCHSPIGNDYMCFCDEREERWVEFVGRIANEDETSIILVATDEGDEAILKIKKGDYRKDKNGNIELRIGLYAEFLKYPKGWGRCEIKSRQKE